MPLPDEAVADESPGLSTEDQAKAEAHAAFIAHPHTQLNQILADLRTPRLDMHDRVGAIQRNLASLAQVILQHTPAPETDQ